MCESKKRKRTGAAAKFGARALKSCSGRRCVLLAADGHSGSVSCCYSLDEFVAGALFDDNRERVGLAVAFLLDRLQTKATRN